jgi:hypothetical protein
MDWLQFIASIFGSIVSLAWPAVVVTLLVIFRKQIVNLPERLEELTLPGGAKAKFEKAIVEGRAAAQKVEAEAGTQQVEAKAGDAKPPPAVGWAEDPFIQLANDFPEAAVMEGFRQVEATIRQIGMFLGLPSTRTTLVIQELQKRKLIDESALQLFLSLGEARNASVHARKGNRITPGEALEYREQAHALNELMRRVLEHLRNITPAAEWPAH